MTKRILFIDDEFYLWEDFLRANLAEFGFDLVCEANPSNTLKLIKKCDPDVVVLDILFGDTPLGKPTLEKIKKKYPALPVMMMTSTLRDPDYFQPDDYRLADYSYWKKPLECGNAQDLQVKLDMIIDRARARNQNADYAQDLLKYNFIVGKTNAMRDIAQVLDDVASEDIPVLITGDTGTGKELVAEAIHFNSSRSQMPFVAVNIAELSKGSLESELFGHVKGSFTGSVGDRKGRFEIANNGTLFLDEIGELSVELQKKLLRVLQSNKIEKMGAEKSIEVDFRLVTATNKDLNQLIEEGQFREDLLYRINMVEIQLPPLRERKEDIPALFEHFINKANKQLKKSVDTFLRPDVRDKLCDYSWPGNIRQLENLIYRAVIVGKANVIQTDHFPELAELAAKSVTASTDASAIANQIFNGDIDYKGLLTQFGVKVKSPTMREVIIKTIERWIKEYGSRPGGKDLAHLLSASHVNIRQILKQNDIQLLQFSVPKG